MTIDSFSDNYGSLKKFERKNKNKQNSETQVSQKRQLKLKLYKQGIHVITFRLNVAVFL